MQVALGILVSCMCCIGAYQAWQMARADILARQDTPDSLRAAIRLQPDAPEYYMRLSQLDPKNARNLLESAVKADLYNAPADIELALQYEALDDTKRAEQLLMEAASVDHTYLPRWSLANFYFRRENWPQFWEWARRASEMPADNVMPLFALCWHASADPYALAQALLHNNPALIRQYITFLADKHEYAAAAHVATQLVRYGDRDTDQSQLFSLINQIVASLDPASAKTVWRSIIEHGWVVADQTTPNNSKFDRDPLPVSFDWWLTTIPGIHSETGSTGLSTEFSGDEPEAFMIADQAVVLAPGDYNVRYAYQTSGIAPDTGIQWEIYDARTGNRLLMSPNLASDSLTEASVPLSVPPSASLLHVSLYYRRSLGTTRISGGLVVRSIQISPRIQP